MKQSIIRAVAAAVALAFTFSAGAVYVDPDAGGGGSAGYGGGYSGGSGGWAQGVYGYGGSIGFQAASSELQMVWITGCRFCWLGKIEQEVAHNVAGGGYGTSGPGISAGWQHRYIYGDLGGGETDREKRKASCLAKCANQYQTNMDMMEQKLAEQRRDMRIGQNILTVLSTTAVMFGTTLTATPAGAALVFAGTVSYTYSAWGSFFDDMLSDLRQQMTADIGVQRSNCNNSTCGG